MPSTAASLPSASPAAQATSRTVKLLPPVKAGIVSAFDSPDTSDLPDDYAGRMTGTDTGSFQGSEVCP
jgi:hypothetical protein